MRVAFIQFSYGTLLNGAASVMGSLIREGHDVKFYNVDHTSGGIPSFLEKRFVVRDIIKSGCKVVFMSCMTMEMPVARELAHDIKANCNIPIVVGGVHPTLMPEETLGCSDFDYVCVGDGESFVTEFMQKFKTGDVYKIPGIGYRDNGMAIVNKPRAPEDLSTLPMIPYHLHPRSCIVDENGIAYVRATRGCPFSCRFCCNSALKSVYPGGTYLRKKPISDVVFDMKALMKYTPNMLVFSDEMFLTDKQYAMHLFNAISNEIKVPFGFLARVEYITEDIVKRASESGCRYIAMGVECGDEQFRKTFLNRGMTNEQIMEAFQLCKDYGIYTTSLNMIGYPVGNDPELTQSTARLNERLKPDWVQVSFMYPFPGTWMYDYCVKNDLLDSKKIANTTTCFDDSVLKGISLKSTRDQICQKFNKKKFLEGVI